MPKKSKVNKLARMSDEERARYLQHRADMEEEARRRKRELVARFIKNKLDKEEAYGRMNTAKINQEWRYILRKIKCKQMSTEIQGMVSSFNYMMERKNNLIESLMRAIEDSDEQHRRAFHAHSENVSYFLSIGSQSLDKLQAQYELLKNDFLENWDKEETDIIDNQEKSEFKLVLITHIQDRDFKAYKKEKDLERATVKNDLRLGHEEEMHSLSRPKRLEIETYRKQLQEIYATYLEQHKPFMTHYQSLREKDEFYQRDIARNQIKIHDATDNLINLQEEWLKTNNMIKNKLSRITVRKEELTKKYWQMKKDLKTEESKGNDKLTLMVNASQDAITRLENVKQKLNKVLQLAEICRKYEQDGDGVEGYNIDNNVDLLDYENLNSYMIDECKQYSKMEKFILKVNKVKVQTMCLKAEKTKLMKDNIQLKHYIRKYLTELVLTGKERPLSMKVHSDTRIINFNGKINRPVTCIEGALSNAVMHEKRMKAWDRKNKDCEVRAYPRVQCWMETSKCLQ